MGLVLSAYQPNRLPMKGLQEGKEILVMLPRSFPHRGQVHISCRTSRGFHSPEPGECRNPWGPRPSAWGPQSPSSCLEVQLHSAKELPCSLLCRKPPLKGAFHSGCRPRQYFSSHCCSLGRRLGRGAHMSLDPSLHTDPWTHKGPPGIWSQRQAMLW